MQSRRAGGASDEFQRNDSRYATGFVKLTLISSNVVAAAGEVLTESVSVLAGDSDEEDCRHFRIAASMRGDTPRLSQNILTGGH